MGKTLLALIVLLLFLGLKTALKLFLWGIAILALLIAALIIFDEIRLKHRKTAEPTSVPQKKIRNYGPREIHQKRKRVVLDTDGKIAVPSMTDEGIFYRIDPIHATCTCPDWIERRSSKDFRNMPFRLCKHLAFFYAEHPKEVPEYLEAWKYIIRRFAEHGLGLPCSSAIYAQFEGDEFGTLIDFYRGDEKGWYNVYSGYNIEYGYSQIEHRWARNWKPPQAKILEEFILKKIYQHIEGVSYVEVSSKGSQTWFPSEVPSSPKIEM